MPKYRVWLDSGANAHACRTVVIDTEKEFGIPDEEWNALSEEEKEAWMKDVAFANADWGWAPAYEFEEGEEE